MLSLPRARHLISFSDDSENENENELVIPDNLSTLSTEELATLHQRAVSTFDEFYAEGQESGLTDEDISALSQLTTAIEALLAEVQARDEDQAAKVAEAAALAARIGRVEEVVEAVEQELASEEDVEPESDSEESLAAQEAPRPALRINLSSVRRSAPSIAPQPAEEPRGMKDIVLAADVPGFVAGEGLDWNGIGRVVDRRLSAFNLGQYENAARSGRHIREQHGVAVIRKPYAEGMVIQNSDLEHVESVLSHAVDESRLPGGSLVASGGWCAPSETLYDFLELESRDGLISVPEVGVARGGLNFTTGVDFSSIYEDSGFAFTEQDDIDGNFDGNGGGTKPCYHVPCPTFTEERLGLYGVCITAGLLQSRGYPEIIARTTRGALVAHDHKMSRARIEKMVAGSTAITMTADQAGAAAPLLDSIEKQVEHYRYVHRLSRSTTLEAVFPYWVRGVIRSDLALRAGVNMLSVGDAQIDAWFRERGISPQYVYNWQDVSGAADSFKSWPATVSFLLYAAGTWVSGGADVITLDTIYDSVLLGTNDFTALFTEEGMLMAKRFSDSRVVTVALCPSGAVGSGVELDCSGVAVPTP